MIHPMSAEFVTVQNYVQDMKSGIQTHARGVNGHYLIQKKVSKVDSTFLLTYLIRLICSKAQFV